MHNPKACGAVSVALGIAAVILCGCEQKGAMYAGKWSSAQTGGESFELLSEGTVVTNTALGASGRWSVTDDNRLVMNFNVMGSAVTFLGCRDRNMLKIHSPNTPNRVERLFPVSADGRVNTDVTTTSFSSVFGSSSDENTACPG